MCITFKEHVFHKVLVMNALRYFDFGSSRHVLLLIARIAVVLLFIIFGYPKLMGFSGTVQYMASSGAPLPTLAAIIAIVMEVPAAILIILGFFTRPLAVIFIFYTLGTAVIGHHYWDMSGDAVLSNMINFYKNVSIAGAFLLLAIVGPGAISLDRR
ncbi:DoxX family protein [Raoultella terrigena]|uniref:DoxX family protein n=1 Tax=Raoultella terrigena TaxID=577 RepID=UPI002235AE21|nr:DoxX family protein [Raoultella terrigena]